MSEDTFVRELERRADGVAPRHLGFDDVRRRAHGIRRRRRLAASGAVAAVVAFAILVPSGLGGSTRSDGPQPAPPAPPSPSITPGQVVGFGLDAPAGPPPSVIYERPADDVALLGTEEFALPPMTTQVVPYGEGYLAVATADVPDFGAHLYRLDAGFEVAHDMGPVTGALAISPDGTRIAWDEVSPGRPDVLVVAEDGVEVQRITLPDGQFAFPAGFTADAVVYELQGTDTQLGYRSTTREGRTTELTGFEHVWAASPDTDLVAGVTAYDDKANLPSGGASRDGERLWERPAFLPEDLSPDGALLVGYPDDAVPTFRRFVVVDAETGRTLVEFDGGGRAAVVETAWEDDGHVLAVVQQGGEQAILRLGLDGVVERATDPVAADPTATTWYLGGRLSD